MPLEDPRYNEIYPRYDGQSLSNVPATVMHALDARTRRTGIDKRFYNRHIDLDGVNKVALIVLDGLGYTLWMDHNRKGGFFNAISHKGFLMPITSVFPSTTAAAITTVNTGLTPLEHGLPEWVVYMREIGMIINTLPFTAFMSESRVDLQDKGIDPRILYNGRTVYEQLADQGIKSATLTHRALVNSAYTGIIKKGSDILGYVYPSDAAMKLRRLIESDEKSYINLYMENIDTSTHAYGPFTEESRAEIDSVSQALKMQLLDK